MISITYIKTTAAIAALAFVGSANAAIIIVKPTAADASTENVGGIFVRSAAQTINGSGLSSTLSTGDAVPGTYPTHGRTFTGGTTNQAWQTGKATGDAVNGWIMFDLGAVYTLSGTHVWNYNESYGPADSPSNADLTGPGIQQMDIYFATSLDAAFGSTDNADSNWANVIANQGLTRAPSADVDLAAANSYSGETVAFASSISARYVLFDVDTNYGSTRAGLSEVRFIAVPEPSSLALLGLGGVLIARRRRRRKGD